MKKIVALVLLVCLITTVSTCAFAATKTTSTKQTRVTTPSGVTYVGVQTTQVRTSAQPSANCVITYTNVSKIGKDNVVRHVNCTYKVDSRLVNTLKNAPAYKPKIK